MPSSGFPIQSLALEPAIDFQFLTVKPDVSLIEVLALMSRIRSSCVVSCALANSGMETEISPENFSSLADLPIPLDSPDSLPDCILVMENEQLLGVFTERDIVRLTANGIPLTGKTIGEVITQPVITLDNVGNPDLFTALSLLRQHRIRHLPIVNQQGTPIGVVTHNSIRRALQPVNLLTRLRYVRDVMTKEVISAPPTASVLHLAQLMTKNRVSCVVIAEKQQKGESLTPVGIVTERDIVQFQALELDLSRTHAEMVMSRPLFCLNAEDVLWIAHSTMSEQRVRRLVVVGEKGELLGIVSQTSLLQVLNPADMYGAIEILQEAVEQRTSELKQANEQLREEIREREKAESALKEARDRLQEQVEERTAQLLHANEQLKRDIEQRKAIERALRDSESQFKAQAHQLQNTLNDLQQAQLKLIQNEKMSSLGQLVAGIAHEINNPTNFIYGNITYAEEYVHGIIELLELYGNYYSRPAPAIQKKADDLDLDFVKTDLVKLLSSMKQGAERIRNLVLSLRNFSRLDEAQTKLADVHEGLNSTLVILQNQLKTRGGHEGIQIIQNYGTLPVIECCPGQLNQVFMNIISNAIDALEENEKKLNREILEENYLASDSQGFNFPASEGNGNSEREDSFKPTIWIDTEMSPDGEFVVVRIRDNGIGITEEVRQRLFDPFFTTKPVGKGTGLGLAISYQIIVDKHQGHLSCVSTPEEGTEFRIELPVKFHHSQGHNVVQMPNRFSS